MKCSICNYTFMDEINIIGDICILCYTFKTRIKNWNEFYNNNDNYIINNKVRFSDVVNINYFNDYEDIKDSKS